MDPRTHPPAAPPAALLVVIQDIGLRHTLSSALRSEGFVVVAASSTAEALALLRATSSVPSAVVYDQAPDDGQELQAALESAPRWAAIPQLAFAAAADHGPRRALVKAPISFTELLLQLRRITAVLQ
jgi:CheY-like chemotaxis protein